MRKLKRKGTISMSIDPIEAFRIMKSTYGSRHKKFPDSEYTLQLFTEKGNFKMKGEDIPTNFETLFVKLQRPHFINFELFKDGELISGGKLKEFAEEEKKETHTQQPQMQNGMFSPFDTMKQMFELNSTYSKSLEDVNIKYSKKFQEYDAEVDQRIEKQKQNLNEKIEAVEYATKRRLEVKEMEFDLERKKWDLEKEQILARRTRREDKVNGWTILMKMGESLMTAVSDNPEGAVNVGVHLIKTAGAAWRGEPIEIPLNEAGS